MSAPLLPEGVPAAEIDADQLSLGGRCVWGELVVGKT